MKPRPAPIHCPAPRPSRFHAAASNVRSDKSPNRMVPRKSKSTRRRCKPSDRLCKAANSASFLLRAAAKHSRNQRSATTRHETRASYKKLNSLQRARFLWDRADAKRLAQIQTAPAAPVLLPERSLFQRPLFRGPRDRPGVEKAVVAAQPDVPRLGVPGPGAQLRRFFPPQFAVSDRNQEQRPQ